MQYFRPFRSRLRFLQTLNFILITLILLRHQLTLKNFLPYRLLPPRLLRKVLTFIRQYLTLAYLLRRDLPFAFLLRPFSRAFIPGKYLFLHFRLEYPFSLMVRAQTHSLTDLRLDASVQTLDLLISIPSVLDSDDRLVLGLVLNNSAGRMKFLLMEFALGIYGRHLSRSVLNRSDFASDVVVMRSILVQELFHDISGSDRVVF